MIDRRAGRRRRDPSTGSSHHCLPARPSVISSPHAGPSARPECGTGLAEGSRTVRSIGSEHDTEMTCIRRHQRSRRGTRDRVMRYHLINLCCFFTPFCSYGIIKQGWQISRLGYKISRVHVVRGRACGKSFTEGTFLQRKTFL